MLTILHLSDLHRAEDAPVSNDMLLNCLLTDVENHSRGQPSISKCDVIVVTGDIIKGARADDANYADTLRKQYQEAKTFLTRLCEELLGGDLARLFLVPGNHDVCWPLSKQSMEAVRPSSPADTLPMLEQVNSPYRWSWKECNLFMIRNTEDYKNRLVFFKEFFDDLYRNQSYKFSLDEKKQATHFVTPDRKALFSGFTSLVGNDCFDRRGRISLDAVAANSLKLRESSARNISLKIAFWHHNLDSMGFRTDHLNSSEALPMLIDQGYVLGLHGHQHRSGVISFSYHSDPNRFMPVISAGSLCAGHDDIPPGYRRQYNVLEIDEKKFSVRVHVREWLGDTSFVAARPYEFGGKTWNDVSLVLLKGATRGSIADLDALSNRIDEAEILVRKGESRKAWEILKELPNEIPIVRKLSVETLHSLGDWDALLDMVKNPLNADELGMAVDALCKKGDFDGAEGLVQKCESDTLGYDRRFLEELKKRVQAERLLFGVR